MRSLLGRFHRPNARSQSEQLFMLNNLGDGSTLSLDFTTGVLDPRLTFTRSTTGTYINSSGYVTSAAINAARFDYDPTSIGTPRGLLIEGSSTNVILYSQDFSQATWSKSNATATSPTTAPDGTTTAYLLTSTTAAGVISQTHAATGNATSTYSIYVKQGTAAYCDMYIYDATGAGATRLQVRFTFATKSFTTTVGSNPQYQELRDGWFRISATGTTFSTTNNIISYLYVGLAVAGTTYYGWGAQLETGSGASSYIPTVASQGARAGDSCVMPDVSSFFNSSAGTVLVNYGSRISTGSNRSYSFASTDSSNQIFSSIGNGAAFNVYTSLSFVAQIGNTSTIAAKIAGAYSDGDFAVSVSGGGVVTDSTGGVPINIAKLIIGDSNAGGVQNNGPIASLKYWPTRLPNAQLQSLTT